MTRDSSAAVSTEADDTARKGRTGNAEVRDRNTDITKISELAVDKVSHFGLLDVKWACFSSLKIVRLLFEPTILVTLFDLDDY